MSLDSHMESLRQSMGVQYSNRAIAVEPIEGMDAVCSRFMLQCLRTEFRVWCLGARTEYSAIAKHHSAVGS